MPGAEAALDVDGPGAYVPAGSVEVTGTMTNMASVTVNGVEAPFDGGRYTAGLSLAPGIQTFDVRGVDIDGGAHRELRSALAGDTALPDGYVASAVQLHLAGSEIEGLAPLLSGAVDPAALSDMVTAMNPIVQDADMTVYALGVDFGEPVITAVPTDGALEVTIVVPEFQIPLDIDAIVGVEADMLAEQVVIQTRIALGTDGQGGLTVDVPNLDIELVEFELDVHGIVGWFSGMFISDEEAQAMLETELAGLTSELPALIDDALAGIDLQLETELMGLPLSVGPAFGAAAVRADGVYLGLDMAVDVGGTTYEGPGHLFQGAPDAGTSDGLLVQVSDDFLNRFLHEVWAGGALDIELPIESGGLESTILLMFGGTGETGGSLGLTSSLPPTWVERDGESRLQLGGVVMTVDVPGGAYGDRVELDMALDARAEIVFVDGVAGIELSDPIISMEPRGDAPELDELKAKMGEIEGAMGVGIGLVNDLLAFPVEGAETLALPELDLVRDPSGRGMRLALAVADLLDLFTGAAPVDPDDVSDPSDPADPTPVDPPEPEPMEVAIPADVDVYDDDATVDADGAAAWVCRNDDVEVTADDGVWFLHNRAELTVSGTGHIVYASDNADVILLTPGNTVYADVGADVDDQDGTNTIYWVDPMSFDETNAPEDGC